MNERNNSNEDFSVFAEDNVTHGEIVSEKEKLDIIQVKENQCDFFYKEKGKYGVIVFSGILKENSEVMFKKAELEILKSRAKLIAISLTGIDAIDLSGIRYLGLLQKSIRNGGKKLRICGAEAKVKDKLLASGVVRENEMKENLREAFKGFIKAKQVKLNRSRKK